MKTYLCPACGNTQERSSRRRRIRSHCDNTSQYVYLTKTRPDRDTTVQDEHLPRLARQVLNTPALSRLLAHKQTLNHEAARTLAQSSHVPTLKALAANQGTPQDVWEPLQQHPDPSVAETAWMRGLRHLGPPRDRHRHPGYDDFNTRWRQWQSDTYGHPTPDDETF